MSKTDRILEGKDVSVGYTNREIVHDVSLKIEREEILSIIGPNGSGKSTLLKALIGMLKPWEGKVYFKEEDITGMETHNLVKKGIAYLPQGRVVFPRLNVEDHLELGMWTLSNREEKEKRKKEVFNLFPILKERRKTMARNFSGGERQMLALARGLTLDPELLILDEPSLGLSPQLKEQLFSKILQINSQGITILMVEQEAALALELSDRGVVLDQGKIEFRGTGKELLENKEVKKLYLGG